MAVFVSLGLFCLAGCSSVEGLGQVTGVVKLDGKPVAEASVEFTPVDGKGMTSYGRTDTNGYYYMMASRTAKGAAVGQNRVKISTYEVIDNSRSVPEKIPTKYNSATELEAAVNLTIHDCGAEKRFAQVELCSRFPFFVAKL